MGPCMSQHQKSRPYIQEVPESKRPGFSPIYRREGSFELHCAPSPNINSVTDLLQQAFAKHPQKQALGYVNVDKTKDAQGQDVETRSVITFTCQQIKQLSNQLGQSLARRQLAYSQPFHQMRFIGIYSKNRYEWILTDIACIFLGLTSIPLYDTLGQENLTYCLQQTQITSLFVGADTFKILLTLKDRGNLQTVISFDPLAQEILNQAAALKLKVIYFKDLLEEGASIKPNSYPMVKASLDTCLTFSYTSGTTGPPKGAMLSHKNMLAFARGMLTHPELQITENDVYASYLPLPHVMQRAVMLSMIGLGAQIICTSGDILKLKEDCQAIKPTMFISVPRLYNRIVQAVKSKFQGETGVKKWLIDKGVNSKLEEVRQNGDRSSTIYDSLIFSKVKDNFGGKIRLMASGSAPLNKEVQAFMEILMSAPLLEGYGSTETTAGVLYTMSSTPGQYSYLSDTVEVKLCSIPEMNYTAEDVNQKGELTPRGEIWVRGTQVFLGYYRLQEMTKECITSDGWLKTGDVGQVLPHNNAFKIIDRKKNIFKLQQGEYIAPDKVENVYMKSKFITEIFCYGEPTENFVLLIAVPNKDEFLRFAKAQGIEGDYETLARDRKLRASVLKQMNSLAKAQGLNSLQQAKNIYFELESFAVRQIMTNTSKLIRFEARKYYKDKIELMYKEGDILSSGNK